MTAATEIKEDLATCPVELAMMLRGFCLSCDRPMVSKRKFMAMPSLGRWFVRCGSSVLCAGCLSRVHRARTHPPAPPRTPLTPDVLRRLRIEHGACVGCGWTADASHPHTARRCRLAPKRKRKQGDRT